MSQETEFTLAYNRGYTDGLAMGMETQRFKDLTDEEIIKILEGIEYSVAEVETSCNYEIRIARAILRKAQEK